ncbi:transcription factor 20 isoform X2 [Lampris incognitus]|uniref:transcription factor 20 isoform X2 n=1 Tax=Lampris incognitus TaxID=2546036 RepID=UPI0024B56B7A|nr:transcription factor 20 isoform X2 [Lampris incognitus]
MQNFSNSPAPPTLPPGFSGRGGGGPPYPPQPADSQISPRMTEDYTGMQQQSLHRGHQHPNQASLMLGYSARSRGTGEPSQTNIHSGSSSNPYRKDAMDYYFSMGGKDRHRRGGMGYGAGFGYPSIDGRISHQYRHGPTSATSSSGMMSPYPVDYGSTAGSGAASVVTGGAGPFSPSHQFSVSQNHAMQLVSGSQMQHRQHGQTYQALPHGQQHRSYPHSGHRLTPQYPHFSPHSGPSTGSSGMYSPPPQRYHEGSGSAGFDPKVNSSPNVNSSSNSVSSSAAANNVGPMENVQQSYHASNYPAYSPQSHSLHKQATLQHRNSQHSLGVGYDNSLKMQHHGPSPGTVYTKHHQASNPNTPHAASQEMSKSPMHSNAQQAQINQNFSPISNPSPAASAVQSPSCSSSPSPLMGVSEAHGTPSGHAPSHPPPPTPRSSHSHGRLLQTMPQLSPTPNSNSSISSCGSSGSHKAQAINATGAGVGHSSTSRSRLGPGSGIGSREESSSVYPSSPLNKMQDTGLNSINALTSQVANLPNTVHHLLLTDTVLSQKKGKDGGQTQQAAQAMPPSQPRSRNASAASNTSTVQEGVAAGGSGDGGSSEAGADEDSSVVSERAPSRTKVERDEQFSEGENGRVRQMSGASSGSEPSGYYLPSHSQSQSQIGQVSHVKTITSEPMTKQQSISKTKPNESHIPAVSSSQSLGSQSSEPVPNSYSTTPSLAPSSNSDSAPPPQPNCVSESGVNDTNNRYGSKKTIEIKDEGIKSGSEGEPERKDKGANRVQGDCDVSLQQDSQNKDNSISSLHNSEKEGKQQMCEEQQNTSGVGVIVSTRAEGNHSEKSKHPQDNCIEEKHSHSYFGESNSHNGEEGIDLSVYSSHHQAHLKPNFGRPQNPPQHGPYKYGHSEPPYGSDMSVKNRGRPVPGGAIESNSRYPGYHQTQLGYGLVHSKDVRDAIVEAPGKRGEGVGGRSHEDSSQIQPFPSLLQEVLQGCNLDRRYGRPEQAFPAHLQAQQQFQTRHQYGIAESMRIQTGTTEASPHSSQMAGSGKPPQPNQRQGGNPNFLQEPQASIKSEAASNKAPQNTDKHKVGVPQSHLTQSTEPLQPPPKHINLADYSLPRRKAPSNVPTSSSAVQELLLQETEPLTANIGLTESQKSSGSLLAPSSERRSVICDVSPNRRGTPERDRESDREREREKSQSGASVIQQPFSSPTAASDLSKKEPGEKQVVKMETPSKESGPDSAHPQSDHHRSGTNKEVDVEYHSKSVHSSVVINTDPYRQSNIDMTPTPPHPTSTNPLSPPSRHQAFLHGIDFSGGHASSFPGYRYGDAREGNMIPHSNQHFPSHHPYHSLSSQAQLQSPQSTNKLQIYPHSRGPPHHPPDLSDWVTAMNRPSKEMMMQPGSSPVRHKFSQSEQRQRMLSQTDIMPNEQHITKPPLPHQSPYYDLKMYQSTHSGREGAVMIEGEPYYRTHPPPPPAAPVASHTPAVPQMALAVGPSAIEPDVSRGAPEEAKQPRPTSNATKPPADMNLGLLQGQRQTKAGGSGDTNPLMLRRRVRSFISPIPAKRQLQDGSQQRVASNSHHSPGAQSESSHHNEDDSSSSDIPFPRLSSPLSGENAYSQSLSPSGGKAKILPPRKGRGLKLEAIVQKITPNVKRPLGHADAESNHYPGFSHSEMTQFSDSQDQDLAHFSRVTGGDDGYIDESHTLNDMIPFRGVDETGPLPPSAYPCDPHQTTQVLKQPDFDFGLGAAVASSSGDKEDFALLGPLPPPPPLPCPVQGSPPPSSSALSDIQHFTNTYQQLETRRGEQSAANLLRQKLQETGMGFDDYPGSDYYGTTPPHHSQSQGHMLNRQQHHLPSGRSALSPQDSKLTDSIVPKGYFPSGKKKGRPVGSVNKQKRAQSQAQTQAQTQTLNTTLSAPSAPPATSPVAATTLQTGQSTSGTSASTPPPLPEQKDSPPLAPPVLTQVVKLDAESEDTQPEIEVKPLRQRRRGMKDENEPADIRGRQRRRRRVGAAAAVATVSVAKDDPDTPFGAGGSLSTSGGFLDPNRKGLFVPHIHVERKIPEIGAVCTIVNAEEERLKGERSAVGGKAGGSGMDSLLTPALSSQLNRRDREMEKRESDDVETTLPSGKALPSSGYVVSGPVITETNHSGRLLCCLCQKWANYKHLGDLYGPYYPAEYAAKLPKNQPQLRQCHVTPNASKPGPNLDANSNVLSSIQDTQTEDAQITKSSTDSDFVAKLVTDPPSHNTTVRTASPIGGEEIMMYLSGQLDNTTSSPITTTSKTSLTWDMNLDIRPIPELKREPDLEVDQQHIQKRQQQPTEESQQRPQHRKLTSHPRFKRRHKSSEESPRMVPSNSKASLPFQPPPPALDSLGPLAQLAQLPQMPMDPEELWVHEGCIVWTSGVYLVNGRLYGLQEALDGARDTSCSYCEMVGSTLGCYSKGCTLRYHYLCAIEADCSLNEDNFSLRCPKHKSPQSSRPAKSVYLEQSERG